MAGITAAIGAAPGGASAGGHDPARLGHGLIGTQQRLAHGGSHRAGDQQQVGKPRRGCEKNAQPVQVVEGVEQGLQLAFATVARTGVHMADVQTFAETFHRLREFGFFRGVGVRGGGLGGVEQIGLVAHAKRPVMADAERAFRADLGAELATDAAGVIELNRARFAALDGRGRADRDAIAAAALLAGTARGIEARQAEHALLPVRAGALGPGGGGAAFLKAKPSPYRHGGSPLSAVSARDGQAEAGFVDGVIHHVAVLHSERKHPPVRERRLFDFHALQAGAVFAQVHGVKQTAARGLHPAQPFALRIGVFHHVEAQHLARLGAADGLTNDGQRFADFFHAHQ